MFYLNRNEELNEKLLNKMINRFNINVKPQLERSKQYYDGIQAILRKTYADETKPWKGGVELIKENDKPKDCTES